MTTPSIFADGYTESASAFLNAPTGQGDSPRVVIRSATIPASTVVTTVIGLVPFNKGARVSYGSALAIADLDTGTDVVLTWGFVYDDDTSFTNDPDAFAAGAVTAQAGGVLFPTATAGATFDAEADGWIVVVTSGGSTTTEGVITFNGEISYQG